MNLGFNDENLNINEQNIEFNKIDLDMPDAENVITRAEFLKKIYNDAKPYIKNLIEEPNNTEIKKKLAQLNRSIKKRNQ